MHTSIFLFSQGQQPYIQGLLSVYKLYCPHLVAISIPASYLRRRHGFFKQIDRKWSAKIRAVQDAARVVDRENGLAGDMLGSTVLTRLVSDTTLRFRYLLLHQLYILVEGVHDVWRRGAWGGRVLMDVSIIVCISS